jgi:hypothetical protein
MIITQLTGGVGNQMFQYAFGRALSLKFNVQIYLDTFSYKYDELRKYELDAFTIQEKIADTKMIKAIKNQNPPIYTRLKFKLINKTIPAHFFPYFKEEKFSFNENTLLIPKQNVYLEGYWQTEKYFKTFRSNLLNDFTLRNPISEKARVFQKIIENAQNSVAVHVRRGDYVQNEVTKAYHGVCDLEYYKSAMENMKIEILNPTFFIFSDDKDYVKNTFFEFQNCIFIEGIELDVEELFLMSICKNNIIANSSFSWWGAWLNKNENKCVIAPKRWFQIKEMQLQSEDLIPDSWIKL